MVFLEKHLIIILLFFCCKAYSGEVLPNADSLSFYYGKSIESIKSDDISSSIYYLTKAKEFSSLNKDKAEVFNHLGTSYFKLADYHSAIKYYDSAFVMSDSVNQNTFIGYLYNNYGLAYTQLEKFEKAILYYKKSIEKIDESSKGIVYNNIAKSFSYKDQQDSTKKYYSLAYSINRELLGENNFYTLLAALELAEISGDISPYLQKNILNGSSDFLKGLLYSTKGDFEMAEKYLKDNTKALLKLHIKSKQWKKAVATVDILRNSQLSVDSKLFLQANERSIYKNAIDEDLQNNDTLSAFIFALKSHSNLLKEDVNYQLNKFPNSFNYFDFDSIIYLFTVEPEIHFYKIEIDSIFNYHYTQFLSVFNLNQITNNYKENYIKYAESSNYLFEKLIPYISEDMLIIPEGKVFLIPFETLLTEFPDTTIRPNYKHLPYLIQKSTIHYDFMLREYDSYVIKHNKINGFAPDVSLKYAVKEIEQLRKYNSKRNIGSDAQLDLIKWGNILHIATHYNPSSTKLKFADTVLNIEELPQLSKDLTVLSTCYSGIGKYHIGEGTFSASRAFYKAGSESVIESLWPNNDKSAHIIFALFYKNLQHKHKRDISLTLAKKKYLSECYSYMSHPYFWANLRFFGNNDILPIHTIYWFWILIVITLLFTIVLLYYIFRCFRKN